MPVTQLICLLKNYDLGKMKTDIEANLLDDSIIVNTFEKVVKSEIKRQVFLGDAIPYWCSKGKFSECSKTQKIVRLK